MVLFPRESIGFSVWLTIRVYLFTANLRLRWMSWCLYRRFKRDWESIGLQVPPFRYVPIQDRDIW